MKRNGKLDERNNIKKIKLDNEIESLWGDEELDESIFDDLKFDGQELKKKSNNVNESIFPAYDEFKVQSGMVCSTQVVAQNNKLSSFTGNINKTNEEVEARRLRLNEEKDGEIAILRSQLCEIKAQNNAEFQKSQFEWKNKCSAIEKQVQSLRSELDFKNLNIANLKQKVITLQRQSLNNTGINCAAGTTQPHVSKEEQIEQGTLSNKLYSSLSADYPLKGAVNDVMHTVVKHETFLIENKLIHSFKNAIPYLQNKSVSTRVISDKGRAELPLIYPIMLKFCQFRTDEIESSNNTSDLTKIICIGLQSLDDLLDLLQDIKHNLRTEDILEADSSYLKRINNSKTNCSSKNEIGRKSSFVIQFLSELLPYCSYLKDYFFENKPLHLKNLEAFIKNLPYIISKTMHNGQDFLSKLVNILKIVGEIRKANDFSSFLHSTTNLFTNICKLKGYDNLASTVCTFSKELIFLRPPHNITFQFTYLLKEASRYPSFVKFLLNKTKKGYSAKKGVLYFNKDACRFYIFVLIFNRYLNKNEAVPTEIFLNLLFFMYNTFKSSYFLHHQNIKECACLQHLYNLEIEIMFRILERCPTESTQSNKKSEVFFDNKIVLKILKLMAFHCYELTEEHVSAHSQFKEIDRQFREQGVYDLERYINEEIPEINSKSFDNIQF